MQNNIIWEMICLTVIGDNYSNFLSTLSWLLVIGWFAHGKAAFEIWSGTERHFPPRPQVKPNAFSSFSNNKTYVTIQKKKNNTKDIKKYTNE